FTSPATTEFYTLSLHDALPISVRGTKRGDDVAYQLRLANAARVPANNDQAPPAGRFFVIFRQAFPLTPRCARPIAEAGHTMRTRSEEHTSELQSRGHLVCRLLL